MPKEFVKCDTCDLVYDDEESIKLVKQWLSNDDKYAPCPNIGCKGQLQIKGA